VTEIVSYPPRSRRLALGFGLYVGFVLALVAAAMAVWSALGHQAPPPQAGSGWVGVPRPERLALAGQGVERAAPYRSEERSDGARRETLTIRLPGGLSGAVQLVQAQAEAAAPAAAVHAARAQAGQLGLVRPTGRRIDTKFGPAEMLEGAWRDGRCATFALAAPSPGVLLQGHLCRAGTTPLEAPVVACLVGRLTISPAREDAALAHWFAAAEMRRDADCSLTAPREPRTGPGLMPLRPSSS
jgi:hypothetical protein